MKMRPFRAPKICQCRYLKPCINEVSEPAILTTSQWKHSEYYHIDCMENNHCSTERLHLLPLKVKQTVKQIRHVPDQVGAAASFEQRVIF